MGMLEEYQELTDKLRETLNQIAAEMEHADGALLLRLKDRQRIVWRMYREKLEIVRHLSPAQERTYGRNRHKAPVQTDHKQEREHE